MTAQGREGMRGRGRGVGDGRVDEEGGEERERDCVSLLQSGIDFNNLVKNGVERFIQSGIDWDNLTQAGIDSYNLV